MSDDDLHETLGRALRAADPVPESVHRATLDAFDFVDLDANIARLVDAASLTSVRGDDGPQLFETDDGAWEITVDIDGRDLRGQLAPPVAASGAVEVPNGDPLSFTVGDDGAFELVLPAGASTLRVSITTPEGTISTTWLDRP